MPLTAFAPFAMADVVDITIFDNYLSANNSFNQETMRKSYHVYILTNTHHTVLYTGVTGNIIRRIWEHKQKLVKGFTKRYNVTKLVYLEEYPHIDDATSREKQIKAGSRQDKLDLIKELNPEWKDLYNELLP